MGPSQIAYARMPAMTQFGSVGKATAAITMLTSRCSQAGLAMATLIQQLVLLRAILQASCLS